MKKTQKNILGFAGLVFVAIMTTFAAFLPNSGVLATSSSITDTVVVRVVATTPNVTIVEPENGKVFTKPKQDIVYTYENVNTVTVTLEYTDLNGNTQIVTLEKLSPGGQAGTNTYNLNLDDYGYGTFKLRIAGVSSEGVPSEDIKEFSYQAQKNEDNIPVPDTGGNNEGAPNTGGLFGGLNISKSDYLITGVIIFFLISICGIIIIAKKKQEKKQ